jgi:hypothetical protein
MSLLRLFRYLVEQTSESAVCSAGRSLNRVKTCSMPKSDSETGHTAGSGAGTVQVPAKNSLDSFEALDITATL